MKNQNPLTIIMLFLSVFFIRAEAQVVEYKYDGLGNIISRKVITFTSDRTTDPTMFEDKEVNIKLYPNPTQGILKIEVSDHENGEVLIFRIYDMNGRLLLEVRKNEGNSVLDMSHLENGAYVFQMTRSGKNSSWRIIKTN